MPPHLITKFLKHHAHKLSESGYDTIPTVPEEKEAQNDQTSVVSEITKFNTKALRLTVNRSGKTKPILVQVRKIELLQKITAQKFKLKANAIKFTTPTGKLVTTADLDRMEDDVVLFI
jgi:hypothetical protein